MGIEMLDDGQGRAELVEQIEKETDDLLDLLIRVQDQLAERVVDKAGGRAEAQSTLLSFLQLSALQVAVEPMQFGFAHGALEAQEQAVVVLVGIVNAFFVDHQSLT